MSRFSEAISYLTADDPRARITAIKTAVVEGLRAADSRIDVTVTDHFNHSWVPDLVLSWPDTNEERNVFLRTSFREWDLLTDLEVIGKERPIIIPLADIRPSGERFDEQLETRSRTDRTLIADPSSIEAFDQESRDAPVVTLLSHAMLQGGRGLFPSDRIHSISETVDAGFSGAQQANYEATNTAVQAAESALDSHRASQMNRLLHAVWVGSGAPPSAFPGAGGVTATLDPEALRFILSMPEFDSDEFWDRLGRGLTTRRLCQLVNFEPTANLQRLLARSVHRLQAKACRVVPAVSNLVASQWQVSEGTLMLRTPLHRIYFAPNFINELPQNTAVDGPISVSRLRDRAERISASIAEVRLSNGDSHLTYGSDERPDVSRDGALAAVEEVVRGVHVTAATAQLGGSRTLRCNYTNGTGAGNSSSRFYVTELASVAVPLLAEMPAVELDDLRAVTSGGEQAPIDLDVDEIEETEL